MNQSEYVKTVGNISDLNKVYLGFHEGLQYSVLGPAHIPDGLDFQATSYGSHTECRIVTPQCGAENAFGARDEPPSAFDFACNGTMAGLNMTGNFDILSQTKFGFEFQYFYNSAKQQQVPLYPDSDGLGDIEYGPISNITNQYFWALAFSLNIEFYQADATNPWARLNLVASQVGGPEGIMSCETNISEIVRLAHSHFKTLLSCPYLNILTLFLSLRFTLTSASLPSDL